MEANLSDSAKATLAAFHIDPQWLDANVLTRVAFAGLMLIYSSFFLGWGSHLLGAAIVLLPTPLLMPSLVRHAATAAPPRWRANASHWRQPEWSRSCGMLCLPITRSCTPLTWCGLWLST